VGGATNCTTCENLTLADLAVVSIYQRQFKLISYRFKRGFFCGVCIEKGARSFVGENLKKQANFRGQKIANCNT